MSTTLRIWSYAGSGLGHAGRSVGLHFSQDGDEAAGRRASLGVPRPGVQGELPHWGRVDGPPVETPGKNVNRGC